jgi:hypothetical protein
VTFLVETICPISCVLGYRDRDEAGHDDQFDSHVYSNHVVQLRSTLLLASQNEKTVGANWDTNRSSLSCSNSSLLVAFRITEKQSQ